MSFQVQSPGALPESQGVPGPMPTFQNEPDRKLAKKVFDQLKAAQSFRRNFDKDWPRFWRYFRGQQWLGPRPDYLSTPVINYTWSTIQSCAALMTDSSPTVSVMAVKPEFEEGAEVMQQILNKTWEENRMQVELYRIIIDMLIYGTSFAKVFYDKYKKKVKVEAVDPRNFFPAPGSINIADAEYVCYAAAIPKHKVESMFPAFKGKILGGPWDETLVIRKDVTSQKESISTGTIYIQGQEPGTSLLSGASIYPQYDRNNLVTYVEYWHRDPEDWQKTMLTIMANGICLQHSYNPFNDGKFPFVRFIDNPESSTFWGIGEVHQIEKLQDSVNMRRGQILDILRMGACPPFVFTSNSGLNPKSVPNMPGAKLMINPGSDAKWMNPPVVHPGLFQVQAMDKTDFDIITGINDVTQGRRPKGITAASAIIALQEAAQTRLRPKVRLMEESLTEMGEMMLSRIQQFYDDEEVIRIAGGHEAEYLTVNQDLGDGTITNNLSIGEYQVNVGVGSVLPVDKGAKYEMLKELHQLAPDLVDSETLARAVPGVSPEDVDNWIRRRDAQQAQQLQMMQAAQQAQPPAPAAPAQAPAPEPAPKNPAEQGIPHQAALAALSPDHLPGVGLADESELRKLGV